MVLTVVVLRLLQHQQQLLTVEVILFFLSSLFRGKRDHGKVLQ